MSKNKKTKHAVYNLNYHIVFVTKYRHKVLSGEIETYFWGSGLFSRGCYYGSAGTVSSATIQKYIENQKHND